MENVLQINHLTKKYKNGRGVADISFSVAEGEIVGLLGPNGSGKTTIMKSILGMCRIDSGEAEIFGVNAVSSHEEALRDVGALVEQPSLYENLSALKQLKLMARFYPGLSPDAPMKALAEMGLDRFANEKARRFSLGMKQRLGLALAFFSDPRFLILDEPTNGMDIESSVYLRNRIAEMAEKAGKTFLVSGHRADELERLCHRVLILCEGELIDDVAIEEVLRLSPSLEDYFLEKVRSRKGGEI